MAHKRNQYRNREYSYDMDPRNDRYPEPRHNYSRNAYAPRSRFKTYLLTGMGIIGVAAASVGVTKYYDMKKELDSVATSAVSTEANPTQLPAANQMVKIISVTPNYKEVKKPYQSCKNVTSTEYVQNQKNGTTGGVVGGATGAVAGGIIGNQVKQGGVGTAIGAVVGATAGALAGREIQRSNQPEYVAQQKTIQQCTTEYKTVKKISNYNVEYIFDNNVASTITKKALKPGSTISLNSLNAVVVH